MQNRWAISLMTVHEALAYPLPRPGPRPSPELTIEGVLVAFDQFSYLATDTASEKGLLIDEGDTALADQLRAAGVRIRVGAQGVLFSGTCRITGRLGGTGLPMFPRKLWSPSEVFYEGRRLTQTDGTYELSPIAD